MPRRPPLSLGAAVALLVVGCATTPLSPPPSLSSTADQPFSIDGRLSARRGKDIVALTFAWTHGAIRDDIVLTTPLGQTVAELSSDNSTQRLEVRTADGRNDTAGDWASLTQRVVGFPLPVDRLAWWARGVPRSDSPHAIELDAAGRTNVMRQEGCEIVYGYGDDSARLPSRLNLGCGDVEMRIVIDRWRAG